MVLWQEVSVPKDVLTSVNEEVKFRFDVQNITLCVIVTRSVVQIECGHNIVLVMFACSVLKDKF